MRLLAWFDVCRDLWSNGMSSISAMVWRDVAMIMTWDCVSNKPEWVVAGGVEAVTLLQRHRGWSRRSLAHVRQSVSLDRTEVDALLFDDKSIRSSKQHPELAHYVCT